MKNKILCFHHSDLDGMGVKLATMVFAHACGLEVETFKCDYGDIDSIILEQLETRTDETIVIGDISVQSKEVAEKLQQIYETDGNVVLRDHHATAKWLNKYYWAEVKETDSEGVYRCGTYWTADYLFSRISDYETTQAFQEFISLVDDYDTWKWMDDPENPNTAAENLNSIFKMLGEKKFTDNMFTKLINNQPIFDELSNTLVEVRNGKLDSRASSLEKDMMTFTFVYTLINEKEMKALQDFYESERPDRAQWARENLKRGYSERFEVGIVFESTDISDIGNRILTNHPELDFLIFVSLPKFMSYRSQKQLNIPLGIMAKHITGYGGGHPQSAGGSINPHDTQMLIRRLIPELGTYHKKEEK